MARLNVGIDVKARVGDALRGIAQVKLALRGLRQEHTMSADRVAYLNKQSRDLNKSLDRQSKSLKALTGDYFKLRRILLTFTVRTALTGLTALTSAMNSAGTAAITLMGSLGNLGAAGGIGAAAGLAATFQALAVVGLAWNKWLTKALGSSGKTFEKAMARLTKPAREFVMQLKSMRTVWDQITLLAQQGLFPGLVKALQAIKPLIEPVKHAVYDTAQMLGYLAQRLGEMGSRRTGEFERFFTRNIVTIGRLGRAVENFAFGLLQLSDLTGPLVSHMTKDVEKWSKGFLKFFESPAHKKGIKSFLGNLRKSWDDWTSIIGSVGKTLFNVWDAIQPVIHKVDGAIKKAIGQASKWTADNKSGIRKYFQDSLGPMSAFLRLLGGLAKIWVDFSNNGNKLAIRFFDGLRTKLLPVLKDFFDYLGGNLFPKMMDIGGALLTFIHDASPGIKGLLSLFKPFADVLVEILQTGGDIVRFFSFNKITSALSAFLVTATIITSWKKLKTAINLAVLTTRGLAGVPDAKIPTRRSFSSLVPGIGVYRGAKLVNTAVRNAPQHIKDVFHENVDRGALAAGVPVPRKEIISPGGIILPSSYSRNLKESTSGGLKGGFKSFFTKPTGFFRTMFGLGGFGPAIALVAAPFIVAALVSALRDKRPQIVQALDSVRVEPTAQSRSTADTRTRIRIGLHQDPRVGALQTQLGQAIKDNDFRKMQRIATALNKIGDAAQDAGKRSQLHKIAGDIGALQAQVQGKLLGQVAPDFENFYKRGDKSISGIRDGLAVLQENITAKLPLGGQVFKQAMSDSFGAAAAAVAANMAAIGHTTAAGMRELHRLLVKQLTELGFTPGAARNIVLKKQRYDGGPNEGSTGYVAPPSPVYPSPGGPSHHAVGGSFYLGHKGDKGRDNIPMQIGTQNVMAGSGEYVGIFNHTQQKAFDHMARTQGYGSMEGFFRGNSRPHFMSVGGITKLGHRIQGMGPYSVGENSHFGGVHPVHVKNSLHYHDEALDINADGAPGGEKKWLSKLAKTLISEGWHVLWQVPGHFNHLHVDDAGGNGLGGGSLPGLDRLLVKSQPGVGGALVQGALDLTHAVMQSTLKSLGGGGGSGEGEPAFGGGGGGGSAGQNMKLAKSMMQSFGWDATEWPAWRSLGMGESGWSTTAKNSSSGAFGIGQFLGQTKDAYAKYGATSSSAFGQINAMGHYIKDRYGSPSAAYSAWLSRSPHWYSLGGMVGASTGAMMSAQQPTIGGALPNVNPQLTPYDHPGTDAFGRPLKKPHPKKPPYKFTPPGGHPTLGGGYGQHNFNPKHKMKAKKPSKNALRLANKQFKYPSLVYTDPVTGEQHDLSLGRYDYLEGVIGDWNIDLTNLSDKQSLTTEESIVTLDDGTDVVNTKGNMVNGKFIPGIEQYVAKQMDLLTIHEGRAIKGTKNKGIVGAMMDEQGFLTALPTKRAIKEYHRRLAQMRKMVLNRIRLRKKYSKKLGKLGGKFGWRNAISSNDDIISAWAHWKRDARGESPAADRQADHEMDRLRGENKWLRENKPSPSQIKGATGGSTADKLGQVRADLKFLMGNADATGWDPGAGGQVGIVAGGLSSWKDADDVRTTGLGNLKSSLPAEQTEVARIRSSIADWTGTKLPPGASQSNSSTALDDILKSIGLDVLKGNNLLGLQAGVLNEFNPLLNGRMIGAFAQGGVVPQTGMALVHKGEFINPAPDGGYRNGINAAPNVTSGHTIVELHFKDRSSALVELVDSRVRKVAPGAVAAKSGTNTRRIVAARGGINR